MNRNEITKVLFELYNISGFRVSLHDVNFEEIAAYPESKLGFCAKLHEVSHAEFSACLACDRDACKRVLTTQETIIYTCRHGLIEVVSPLYNFGTLTGFLMMGQVFAEPKDRRIAIQTLRNLGIDPRHATEACENMHVMNEDKLRSYVHIMTICAQYLTLSNAVTSAKPSLAEMIVKYLTENYTRKITVGDLCTDLGYSKSTILSCFKRQMGTTVGAYLNELRLEKAAKLIIDTDMSINEIALSTGFSDQSYFSKVFLHKYGTPPSEYRKENQE